MTTAQKVRMIWEALCQSLLLRQPGRCYEGGAAPASFHGECHASRDGEVLQRGEGLRLH